MDDQLKLYFQQWLCIASDHIVTLQLTPYKNMDDQFKSYRQQWLCVAAGHICLGHSGSVRTCVLCPAMHRGAKPSQAPLEPGMKEEASGGRASERARNFLLGR